MRQVEYHRWYLPGRTPRSKPYLSSWKMTAEEAAQRGAIRPEPTSREVREIPETPEEEAQHRLRTDTSVAAAERAKATRK